MGSSPNPIFFFFNLFLVLNYNSIGNEEIFGENLAEGFCDPGGFLGIWGWGFVGFAPFLFHEEEKKNKFWKFLQGNSPGFWTIKKFGIFTKFFPIKRSGIDLIPKFLMIFHFVYSIILF